MKFLKSYFASYLPLLIALGLLIAGRVFVDGYWNWPRVGFSALLFFFFAIALNRWAAVCAALSLEALLASVSYIKFKATGEPLLGRDLLEVGQGMALTGYIDSDIIISALILLASIAAGVWFRPQFKPRRLAPGLLFCGLVGVQFDTSGLYSSESQIVMRKTLKTNYVFYNFRENVRQNGILGHLVLSAETMHVPKDAPHHFYDEQLPPAEAQNDSDIVVVMCESCYTSRDNKLVTAMAKLNDEGFQAARVISPVYGGGTADAEFEALTGLSSLSLPGIDFQNFSSRYSEHSATLASELHNAGFNTTGMHNYFGTFYKRKDVYPKFGFAQTRFVDQMVWDRKQGWPKDSAMYDAALAQYRAAPKKQKQFMFLVTVSTHGPFVPNNDTGVGQYQQRLGLAIDDFIAFSQQLEKSAKARRRDLTIIIFGDHKPALNAEFINNGTLPKTMFQRDKKGEYEFKNNLSASDQRLRGDVPLFVYTSRADQANRIATELNDKPLFCLPAALARETIISSEFFNAVAARCERNSDFYTQGLWWRNVFPEALYAERLFGA